MNAALFTIARLSCVLSIATATALAATDTWNDASNGSWDINANWFDNSKPSASDDVLLDHSHVTLPASLYLSASGGFTSFTIKTLTLNTGVSNTLASSTSNLPRTLTLVGDGAGAADLLSVSGSNTLTFQSSGTTGTLSLVLGDNGKFNVGAGSTLTIQSILSGVSKSVEKTGDGALILLGDNTFSGGLKVSAGTTYLSRAAGAGDVAGFLTLNGGTLNGFLSSSTPMAANPVVVSADSNMNADRGSSGVANPGSGVTYTFGALSIGAHNLNVSSTPNLTSGTGGITFLTTTLTGNAIFHVTNGASAATRLTLGAFGTTSFGITKTGNGTLSFSSANFNYSGDTILNVGTLNIPFTNALQKSVLHMNGGSITFGTSSTTGLLQVAFGGLSGAGNINLNNFLTVPTATNLTLGNSNAINPIYSGALSNTHGAATLTKVGSNTQTLSGSNTYTGVTTISGGTLKLGTGGSLAAGTSVSIAAGATLDLTELTASASTYAWTTASLSASGTTGAATIAGTFGGTISMGSTPITLTYDGSNASLTVTGASLLLGNNPITVVIPGTALRAGTYTLASAPSITGAVNPTPLYTGGNGLANGATGVVFISDSKTLVLTVTGGVSNYATWASDPTKGNIPGEPASGDFDRDGLTNLMEYALDTNPRVSSQPAGVVLENVITFSKGADAIANADVSWIIQTSETLEASGWTDQVTQPVGDLSATISYTFTPPSPMKTFARLKVVQP